MPPLRLAIPAVAAAWAVIFEIPRFAGLVGQDPAANDFRLVYVAAEAGERSGWSRMYEPNLLQQLSAGFRSDQISAAYTYQFPPLVAWIVVPLTLLPIAAAFYLWTAFNVAAFTAASRLVFPRDGYVWLTVLAVSLALWPTAFALERGQPDLLVYALAAASCWLAMRRSDRWAGVVLGLAWAIKPQVVLLLPAAFLLCGHARAAAWWLLTTAAAWSVFALVLGPAGLGTYLAVLAWTAADPAFASTPVFAPFGAASLVVGQALFGAMAVAAMWRHRHSVRIAFAIGLVGTLASAIHLHEYDYVGLVVAAWLVVGAERVSAIELGWLAVGIVCAQLPAIGVRLPIVVWTATWLLILWLRPREPARSPQRWQAPDALASPNAP